MWTIARHDANTAWEHLLQIVKSGAMVCPRNMSTTEVSPITVTIKDIRQNLVTNPYRKLNYAFAIAEVLWIWQGRRDLRFIAAYNKAMEKFSDDGSILSGAYGPPFSEQLGYVREILRKDPNSRQAVMTIWKPSPFESKDIPCTIMLHFMIRGGKLNLITYMRSNDLWLGFPYDVHTFTTIQKAIAEDLSVGYGTYTHIAGSLHLYEDDWVHAEWALKYRGSPVFLPKLNVGDLRKLSVWEEPFREGVTEPPRLSDRVASPYTWLDLHILLLNAYWRKKRGQDHEFPEPYIQLREASREVRAKVAGSGHARTARGDEGDPKTG